MGPAAGRAGRNPAPGAAGSARQCPAPASAGPAPHIPLRPGTLQRPRTSLAQEPWASPRPAPLASPGVTLRSLQIQLRRAAHSTLYARLLRTGTALLHRLNPKVLQRRSRATRPQELWAEALLLRAPLTVRVRGRLRPKG